MISDVLFEAVERIDYYLENFKCYQEPGELTNRILKLRDEMDSVRKELDKPPSAPFLLPLEKIPKTFIAP